MAHQCLGRTDEAHQCLGRAERWLEEIEKKPAPSDPRLTWAAWSDERVEVAQLFREAEALLNGNPADK
jgi:ferric-dicitrate binding protein FerR (iron transport regulator)